MNTVTSIEGQMGRKARVNVFLDGAYSFSLSHPLATEFGLHVGQTLSPAELEELDRSDLLGRCLKSALRYLQPRPRSESEIETRLRRFGFNADIIQQTLAKLRAQRLVDDVAFAEFWRENREHFRPRSRRALELELRQKGIDPETVAETLEPIDDELSAYRAAQRKARSLAGLDYPNFRRRLGTFLRRRGFAFELIHHTVDQVWRERIGCPPNL